jgi:hypothetical protein
VLPESPWRLPQIVDWTDMSAKQLLTWRIFLQHLMGTCKTAGGFRARPAGGLAGVAARLADRPAGQLTGSGGPGDQDRRDPRVRKDRSRKNHVWGRRPRSPESLSARCEPSGRVGPGEGEVCWCPPTQHALASCLRWKSETPPCGDCGLSAAGEVKEVFARVASQPKVRWGRGPGVPFRSSPGPSRARAPGWAAAKARACS